MVKCQKKEPSRAKRSGARPQAPGPFEFFDGLAGQIGLVDALALARQAGAQGEGVQRIVGGALPDPAGHGQGLAQAAILEQGAQDDPIGFAAPRIELGHRPGPLARDRVRPAVKGPARILERGQDGALAPGRPDTARHQGRQGRGA